MMNLEIMDGEVQISSEHDEYKWVSIEELKELYDEGMLTTTLRLTLEKRNFEIWKDKKIFYPLTLFITSFMLNPNCLYTWEPKIIKLTINKIAPIK